MVNQPLALLFFKQPGSNANDIITERRKRNKQNFLHACLKA